MQDQNPQAVRDMLRSPEFRAWHEHYLELWHQVEVLHDSYRDRLEHHVFRAGELEDRSAEAQAQHAALDGSFEALSHYEALRQETSELWIELQRAEMVLEDHRTRASDLRLRLQAHLRDRRSTSSASELLRRQNELRELERTIEAQGAVVDEARRRLEAAVARRDAEWLAVEEEWRAAFAANLARAEYAALARRTHSTAEHLHEAGGAPREAAPDAELDTRVTELEESLSEHLQAAQSAWGCELVREFLYWPQANDNRMALCVPLVDWLVGLNVQVRALQLCQVERSRGLDFIEPLPVASEAADDPRLQAFFFEGRPTAPAPNAP